MAPGQKMKNELAWYSAGIVLVFLATLGLLVSAGTRARVIGPAGLLNEPSVPKIFIDRPAQAYTYWKQRGFRGRIVISFSRTLDFIDIDEPALIPRGSVKQVFNLARAIEALLDDRNFLYVALRTGIVREVVHVVPASVFPEKIEAAKADAEAMIVSGRVLAPFLGSPRSIITSPLLTPRKEPVLLYVHASFFRDEDPEALFRRIMDMGIGTDAVVLCGREGSKKETALERSRFDAFVGMLKTALPGKSRT